MSRVVLSIRTPDLKKIEKGEPAESSTRVDRECADLGQSYVKSIRSRWWSGSAGSSTLFPFPVQGADSDGVFVLGPGIVEYSVDVFGDKVVSGEIMLGAEWHFQCWYRDVVGPCMGSFNFTNAVSVRFLL